MALPSGVTGPRDLAPFRRAASRCFSVRGCGALIAISGWHAGNRKSGPAFPWFPGYRFIFIGLDGKDLFFKSVTGHWWIDGPVRPKKTGLGLRFLGFLR